MGEYGAKSSYVGETAERYLETRQNDKKWKEEQKIVQKITDRHFARDQSIVDVPFGTGRFAKYYLRKGMKIYGVDISDDMLSEAKKIVNNSSVEFIKGDAESLPFKDGEIDNVICVRLMNWVPIDILESFLKEFRRVSRSKIVVQVNVRTKRGLPRRAIMSLWNNPLNLAKSLYKALSRKKKKGTRKTKKRYHIHDEKDIFSLFERHGLEVQEEYTVREYLSWIMQPLKFYVLTRKA